MSDINKFIGIGRKRSPAIFFPTSTTYTIPVTGLYRISALGGGGSGGSFMYAGGVAASGGGGGGFGESEVYLTASTVITITIGARAAGRVSTGTNLYGNVGGNTVISGTGMTTITAVGGSGGGSEGGSSVNGGVGGTCSGGNIINASGGAGGNATWTTSKWTAGGGGASGSPFGTGGAGGADTCTGQYSAAGGGAVGGFAGGAASGTASGTYGGGASPFQAGANRASLGTGANGVNALGRLSTADTTGIVRNLATQAANGFEYGFETLNNPFRSMSSAGVAGNASAACGAGSSGLGGTSAQFCFFGGSGGVTHNTTAASSSVLFGGGSGGVSSSATSATSGAGGACLAAIERIG